MDFDHPSVPPANEPQPPGLVLLVEDDPAIRGVYEKVLKSAGHSVRTASNGLEAVETMAATEFDVVVSDVTMPGMSGIALLQQIRTRNAHMPVILITACPDVKTAAEAVERQALRYLLKPVPLPTLRSVVAEAVESARMRKVREAHRANVHLSLADLLQACTSAQTLEQMWLGNDGADKQGYAATFGDDMTDEIVANAERARAALDAAPLSDEDRKFYVRYSAQLDRAIASLRQLSAQVRAQAKALAG
jgi:CheY-like chemotaxis protein